MATVRRVDQHVLQLIPDSYFAHYFAGLVMATDGKWEDAEAELRYSEQLGMSPAVVENALAGGISRNALLARFLRGGVIGLVIWLLGLGILFIAGNFLSKATMKALNQIQPATTFQIKPEERRIRTIYRMLINVLSFYFYISIPFVILSLLLLVGGAFYIFLLIGTIPIQLSLILAVTLLASLFAIARALFSRTKDIPPGRQLYKKDAPELWRLVEDVARKLNIRPIDAIYLTPGTDIAVNEKGGLLRKLRGAGRRNLILGMGMLPALNQGQFAAILAHEYGHFSNQDTAGGEMAYHVFASLQQLAQRLIQGRVAYIFNPVWLFVFTYQRIFLRVTLGASRLQEVLADRYAAIAYGSQNFVDGLQSVIRQTIAFPLQANHEVRKSFELKQPIYNLYTLPADEGLQGELNKQLDEQMKRPTSEYDSHPSPHDRIIWVERLNIPYHAIGNTTRPALELLPNPEDLQRELTAQVMKNIKA
jgi:Zn-dependent protease with chaperone function